jgi:hypothetical protein
MDFDCPRVARESRPGGFHLEPLAELDVNLSAHPAPIKQNSDHTDIPVYEESPEFRGKPL